MPKANISINKFDKGLLNKYDRRDIPEGGLHSISGVIPDIKGQLRQGGGEFIHTTLGDAPITGLLKPGYGLFAFRADNSVSTNKEEPSNLIAIQNGESINIYDVNANETIESAIRLGVSSSGYLIDPSFYYIDGELKVSDGNFTNLSDVAGNELLDSVFVWTYKYIRKFWFYGTTGTAITTGNKFPALYNGSSEINNDESATLGDWYDLQAYLFPPSVKSDGNKTHCLYSATTLRRDANLSYGGVADGADVAASVANVIAAMESGNITLAVAFGDSGTVDSGEWMAGDLGFGISFQYDNNQESQITRFTSAHNPTLALDNVPIAVQLFARMEDGNAFDPRLSGINLYWTEDSSGIFDDPLWLGYWHWGSSEQDKSYFESHEGNRTYDIETTATTAYVKGDATTIPSMSSAITYAGLVINTLPAISFEIRNGYSSETESIAAKYKTAVLTGNRRVYIGGVKQYKFDPDRDLQSNQSDALLTLNSSKQTRIISRAQRLDRMIKSPVNMFDTFPDENFIDVAVNDGESITCLMSYADRILQFKENNLYIINISGDYEYLESQHKWMGVISPCQVAETEYGIVWVNKLGCFLYNGEGAPKNLILDKLKLGRETEATDNNKFNNWSTFIGTKGMIGYIKRLRQLVVFEDPLSNDIGNVLIYDIQTGSWSFIADAVSPLAKSNIISNYDDSCMYIANAISETSSASSTISQLPTMASSAIWTIQGLNSVSSAPGTKLLIGSNTITNMIAFQNDANGFMGQLSGGTDNPADYIAYKVNEGQYRNYLTASVIDSKVFIEMTTYNSALDNQNLTFENSINAGTSLSPGSTSITNYKNAFQMIFPDIYQALQWNYGDGGLNFWMSMVTRINRYAITSENAGHWAIDTLYSHLAINGLILKEGHNFGEFYNPYQLPFALSSNTDLVHFAASGTPMWHEDITARKLLNLDTNNLPKITITKASGDYGWGENTLVWEFGTNNDYLDGGISDSHLSLIKGKASAGTAALTNYSDEPDKWPHFYSGGGTTGHKFTHNVDYDDDGTDANSVALSSIVWRHLSNPDEVHISILGDYASIFNIGIKYNISGGSSGNSASTGQSNYLKNMKLSRVESYTSSNPAMVGDEDVRNTLTVIIFAKSDQDASDNGTDEAMATGKWDAIKSYGDLCSSTLTFAPQTAVTIDNTDKDGNDTLAQINSIHISRNNVYTSNDTFFVYLKDEQGNSKSASYTSQIDQLETDISTELIGALNLTTDEDGDFTTAQDLSNVESGVVTSMYVTNAAGDNDTMRVNVDLISKGFNIGDIITFQCPASGVGINYSTGSIYHKIVSMDTVHGATTSGYTQFTIETTAGNLSHDLLYNALQFSSPGTSEHTSVIENITSSAIKYTGRVPTSPEMQPLIYSDAYAVSQVSVLEFINDVDSGKSNNNIFIRTKDIDFGNPSSIKKIYYIDISYKYSNVSANLVANSLRVSAYLNNSNSNPIVLNNTDPDDGRFDLSPSPNGFTTKRLYFSYNISTDISLPISAKSISLSLESLYDMKNFALNDITIVFRDLNR